MKKSALIVLGFSRPIRIVLTLFHGLVVTLALSATLDWVIQIVAGVTSNPIIYLEYVFDLPPRQQVTLVTLFTVVSLLDYIYGWVSVVGTHGEQIIPTKSTLFYVYFGFISLILSLIWIISNVLLRVF